jgi:hypothetical protein
MTSACTWYTYRACQEGFQGLDKQETQETLAVNTWTKANFFKNPSAKNLG